MKKNVCRKIYNEQLSVSGLKSLGLSAQSLFHFWPVVNSCNQWVSWTLSSLAPRVVPVQVEQENFNSMISTLQSVPRVVVNQDLHPKRPDHQLMHNKITFSELIWEYQTLSLITHWHTSHIFVCRKLPKKWQPYHFRSAVIDQKLQFSNTCRSRT
jgi:hypothetical protein